MNDNPKKPSEARDAFGQPTRKTAQASRAPTPRACGCGRAVAYDVAKQAFFCIGCGAFKQCLCLRSAVSGLIRPVNVA